jgi:hypothetical protein
VDIADVSALVVSIVAALIAGAGTVLANRRSKEALRESRKAVTATLWSALQDAIQRLVGFDPTLEPVGERLANLRIAAIALADEHTDWEGLDTWLDAERALGASIALEVMETAQPSDSVDQRVKKLELMMTWTQGFSQNVRFLRKKGYDRQALSKLRTHASELANEIHKRNGWELPPDSNPRLHPLD